MKKLETFVIEKFPWFIIAFSVFWIALVVYGLMNQ